MDKHAVDSNSVSSSVSQNPVRTLKLLAVLSGVLGFLFFLLTPFMPVNQVQSSLSWPQNGTLNSVNAPLMSYSPQEFNATIPISASEKLRPGQSLIVGTLPEDSEDAADRGLFVRSSDGGIQITSRGELVFELTADELKKLPADATIAVSSTKDATTASVGEHSGSIDEDKRPQLTGLYSELESQAASALSSAGLKANVEINSRFTTSPTTAKYATMWLGGIMTVIALVCLGLLDLQDNKKVRFLQPGAWRPRGLDAIVVAILGFWYFIGANTSDDGFILTMGRIAAHADYMANYYRWFGVPESPFGAPYYDLLGLMSHVSTSSIWMRLPSLISGLIVWFALSREVLPRLGEKIAGRRVSQWTMAFVFLAFWLAYNNGLRPEPIIAAGTLLTWLSFEVAIKTERLLPAAVGTLLAAFTLACGPTGLMAVACLLAGLSYLIRIIYRRIPLLRGKPAFSIAAMVAPFAAAGTAVLVAVFGDQTLMNVFESIHVRSETGPSLSWYNEFARYQVLMQQTVDGSFARRVGVFFTFVSVALVVTSILRNGKVPGSNKGPVFRLLLVMVGTLFFMMFTPTKWTHHFGVWAGIAAALAGVGAVALSHMALRSPRSRTLLTGGILFVFAFALSGTNGWWYTSSYSVPWWDKTIQIHEIEASTVMLLISLIVLAIGVLQSFKKDVAEERGEAPAAFRKQRFEGLAAAPIAILSVLAVAFSMASLGKGFISQYPAYSVGLGNLRAAAGNTCNLANDVLVESNTNESFLQPLHSTLGESLTFGKNRAFDPNHISSEAYTEENKSSSSTAGTANSTDTAETNTEGKEHRAAVGVNGSTAQLPFNLDYTRVPVLGSWTSGDQHYAEAVSDWYKLPERSESAPIIAVSAAGSIEHLDLDGVKKEGQKLLIEYGTASDGKVTMLGEKQMIDIGPDLKWRNLRLPLAELPAEANAIRIHATDGNLSPDEWLAFTPPRVPTLETLNDVYTADTPGLLDWAVPLQFPCQRTFNHYAGVAEIPQFRISADAEGRASGASFQDYFGGGVTGIAEAVNYNYQLPSYSKNDWQRDWGSIEVYHPRPNSQGKEPDLATVTTEVVTRSGLWYPGPMNINTDH